jgi:hypothetical protein
MVSLKSIHPQTRLLNLITRNSREYVDTFVGQWTFEKPFNQYGVRDNIERTRMHLEGLDDESRQRLDRVL